MDVFGLKKRLIKTFIEKSFQYVSEDDTMSDKNYLRVLHSFPHRLGMSRICMTAWYEIKSVADAGNRLLVYAGDSLRKFNNNVIVNKTLAMGKFHIPMKIFGGQRLCRLHDRIVASQIPKLADKIDIIHAWPLAALETIKVAKKYQIPVVLERCNAHTRYAYNVVKEECERIGVALPKNHEHAFNSEVLMREEEEYALADGILCPSDFVVKTFLDFGFQKEKLARFIYGVDDKIYFPNENYILKDNSGLKMLYVGVAAVRKGLHFALEAWHKSDACKNGTFLIVGEFLPEYYEKLQPLISHKSIKIMGHRNDVPELMRECDLFILPSIEEGFGLVCTEAMASGCVPLVSDACTDLCRDNENAFVHKVGDVEAIVSQINMLNKDRGKIFELRRKGITEIPKISWKSAGVSLEKAYRTFIT